MSVKKLWLVVLFFAVFGPNPILHAQVLAPEDENFVTVRGILCEHYQVAEGNSVASIAAEYRVQTSVLLVLNPQLQDPERRRPGGVILIWEPEEVLVPVEPGSVELLVENTDSADFDKAATLADELGAEYDTARQEVGNAWPPETVGVEGIGSPPADETPPEPMIIREEAGQAAPRSGWPTLSDLGSALALLIPTALFVITVGWYRRRNKVHGPLLVQPIGFWQEYRQNFWVLLPWNEIRWRLLESLERIRNARDNERATIDTPVYANCYRQEWQRELLRLIGIVFTSAVGFLLAGLLALETPRLAVLLAGVVMAAFLLTNAFRALPESELADKVRDVTGRAGWGLAALGLLTVVVFAATKVADGLGNR